MNNQITDDKIKNEDEKSLFPLIFYIIGFLVLVLGLAWGYRTGEMELTFLTGERNWQLTWIIWLIVLFLSMVFFGIGKAIDLLIKIHNKK